MRRRTAQTVAQDQRRRAYDTMIAAAWEPIVSPNFVSRFAAYHRTNQASLLSNTAALPVFAEAARHRANYGLLGALTFHKRRHTVKTGFGLTRFPVRESFTIAITDLKGLLEREPELPVAAQGFTLTNPFFFNARRRGWEASAYAQDHINATRFPAKILDDVNFTRGFIRPHTVFDFATGRDFSLSERVLLAAQLNIQNLADRFYLITFDSLSSGVAIGRPRAVSGKLTVSFK